MTNGIWLNVGLSQMTNFTLNLTISHFVRDQTRASVAAAARAPTRSQVPTELTPTDPPKPPCTGTGAGAGAGISLIANKERGSEQIMSRKHLKHEAVNV